MKESVLVKGKKYLITSKYGMEDGCGNSIIPREYGAIIRLDNNLFAAIKSGIVNNILDKNHLECLWQNSNLKSFTETTIDFYSVNGKFKYDKKIIACYWSKENHALVIFNENQQWDIAHFDYAKQEIIEDDNYTGLDEVKEVCGGRLLIQRNGAFEILSLKDGMHIGPLDYPYVEPYEKAILFKDEERKCGAIGYHGNVVLSGVREISFEEEYIKAIDMKHNETIYSYIGRCIVPAVKEIEEIKLASGEIFFLYAKEDFGKITYGIYSGQGEWLLSKIPYISILENGMIVYLKDEKFGLLEYEDGKLKEILPAKYKDIELMSSKSKELYIGAKLRFWYSIYDLKGNKLKDSQTPPELWAKK